MKAIADDAYIRERIGQSIQARLWKHRPVKGGVEARDLGDAWIRPPHVRNDVERLRHVERIEGRQTLEGGNEVIRDELRLTILLAAEDDAMAYQIEVALMGLLTQPVQQRLQRRGMIAQATRCYEKRLPLRV